MANYTGIEQALFSAVVEADPGTPTGYTNSPLPDKPDGLWLQVHNLRASSAPATLGIGGEDEHPGVMQIDINYPKNKGSKGALEEADLLAAYFTAGKALVYGGQCVRVESTSLGPGRYVGGYYRLSLNVNYYALTARA